MFRVKYLIKEGKHTVMSDVSAAPGVIHSNQELNDSKHSFKSGIVIKAMSTIQFSLLKNS